MEQNKILERKVITLGDSEVGKTSLILRLLDNVFTHNYLSTIGFDLKKKLVKLDNGEEIRLLIYDTAGQERFRALSRNYIKKANGILIVYDITNKVTFQNAENWIKYARDEMSKNIPMYLVGNKSDLEELRQISIEEGEKLSDQYGLKFYETSSKNGNNVEKCFKDLSKDLYDIVKQEEEKIKNDKDKKVILEEKKVVKKKNAVNY